MSPTAILMIGPLANPALEEGAKEGGGKDSRPLRDHWCDLRGPTCGRKQYNVVALMTVFFCRTNVHIPKCG
jgi:hypothetical protein